MAKLPEKFDRHVVQIRGMLTDGRKEDAITRVIELLREGASPSIQLVAAELLRPEKGKAGRNKENPKYWYEIGCEFEAMLSDGHKPGEIRAYLVERYGYSASHIQNAWRLYETAMEENESAKEGN